MKIQIICVYNNEALFLQMKESVFTRGGGKPENCEVLGLDNTANRFPSAAAAYNYALEDLCDADVLAFCHQDVVFLENSVEKLALICREDDSGLYGAAGIKNIGGTRREDRIISRMAQNREGLFYDTLAEDGTEPVFTLDECFLVGSAKLFVTLRFDEKTCSGWHLYAAELCLQCHEKGIAVKVFDANIVHLSGGRMDRTFFKAEKAIAAKYRRRFAMLTFTNSWCYTDPLRYNAMSIYRRLRYGL